MIRYESRSLGAHVQIALQSLDILLKGFQTSGGDAAEGAGFLALESLFHLNVARGREFVYLHAEVAGRGSRLLLDVGELGLLGADEQRHYGQAQFGVQQWV